VSIISGEFDLESDRSIWLWFVIRTENLLWYLKWHGTKLQGI